MPFLKQNKNYLHRPQIACVISKNIYSTPKLHLHLETHWRFLTENKKTMNDFCVLAWLAKTLHDFGCMVWSHGCESHISSSNKLPKNPQIHWKPIPSASCEGPLKCKMPGVVLVKRFRGGRLGTRMRNETVVVVVVVGACKQHCDTFK